MHPSRVRIAQVALRRQLEDDLAQVAVSGIGCSARFTRAWQRELRLFERREEELERLQEERALESERAEARAERRNALFERKRKMGLEKMVGSGR